MTSERSTQVEYGPALRDAILGSFTGAIEPVKEPWVYRLGLAVVALGMVLLPLVYVGLICLVSYAVFVHATQNHAVLGSSSSVQVGAFLYIGPLLVGIVLVLFMIKPVFAPRRETANPRSLDPREEPLLFAFVERVCAAVGAPAPSRIDVDSQINASASFRRGVASLVSSDLVLTLGLPLVAGLTLEQLAGVLAHEFGHFSQKAGMRLTYVIRSINRWFMRVVYERDSWDAALETAAREGFLILIVISVHIARFFVWLTRRVLWGLMMIGNLISGFMLRQMEYDADRHEARLVGSSTFESTCRELSRLGVAFQWSLNDLETSWREGELVDNLPKLVAWRRVSLAEETLREIDLHVDEAETELFATHPADADRIASALREGEVGVFSSDLGANVLFRDFDALCRATSLDFFHAVLGEEVRAEALRPLSSVVDRDQAWRQEFEAGLALLQSERSQSRRMALPELDGREEVTASLRARLAEIRSELFSRREGYAKNLAEWVEVQTRLLRDAQIEALHNARLRVSAKDFGIEDAAASTMLADRAAGLKRLEELAPKLLPSEELAASRLVLALSLRSDGRDLYRAAAALEAAHEFIPSLCEEYCVLSVLLPRFQEKQSELVAQHLLESCARAYNKIILFRGLLRDVPYPLEHAQDGISMADACSPGAVLKEDVGAITQALEATLELSAETRQRLFGRLALLVLETEDQLGFERLPRLPEA